MRPRVGHHERAADRCGRGPPVRHAHGDQRVRRALHGRRLARARRPGQLGQTFDWSIEQLAGDDEPTVVTLAPDGTATASLEWTGELAGSDSERLSVIAVQLATGQPATLVHPGSTDIGMFTTVLVGPWQAAR